MTTWSGSKECSSMPLVRTSKKAFVQAMEKRISGFDRRAGASIGSLQALKGEHIGLLEQQQAHERLVQELIFEKENMQTHVGHPAGALFVPHNARCCTVSLLHFLNLDETLGSHQNSAPMQNA